LDAAPYSDRSHEIKVAETLANLGHEVHLTVERTPLWTKESPKPAGIASVTVAEVNNPAKAAEIAAKLPDCDVGFASSVSGAPILAAWKKRTRKPVVAQVLDVPLWRLQFGDKAHWKKQWEPWHSALYEMSALIANTHQTVQDLAAAQKIYQEDRQPPPVAVVYYGIDTEAADQATAHLRPEGGYPMAVSVSRLVPYKGVEFAIAGLAILDTEIAFYVVGDGEDLMRLIQLDRIVYGLTTFTGGVSDKVKFEVIKTGDFGVGLAYNPHIPLQFPMESVYCGKPCLVADTAVNRERFLDKGVLYVNPMNTRAIADAIARLVKGDVFTAQEMAAHREWIMENRSFKSHATGVLSVLESLTQTITAADVGDLKEIL
ncbi:MAG: glycosyltransferase, partial [Sulfuricaulis sp.]|nr:glycosyltransferase [Sulfuricaulis sp.]